jgi:hypothetical protein
MEDQDQVSTFHLAGGERGNMALVYLYNAAQICDSDARRAGVGFGCGPGNQLGLVARLKNPDVRIITSWLCAIPSAFAELQVMLQKPL